MVRLITFLWGIAYGALPALGAQFPPLHVIDGNVQDLRLGIAVDAAGDVDGNGTLDFLIGASEGSALSQIPGQVTVHSGVDGTPLLVVTENQPGTAFGAAVAGAGDVDGDGFADIVVGARYDSTFAIFAGRATVFSGLDGSVLHTFLGDGEGDRLGNDVDGAGDVNGDGHDDVIVGSFFDNEAAFWAGSARVFSGANGALLHEFLGNHSFDTLGTAVAGAGDVDGDGTPDLIVGAPGEGAGSARVYSGASGATLHTFLGDAQGDDFGSVVDGAGDVNDDGHADLIVGTWMADGPASNAGLVRVFSGADGSVLFELRGVDDNDHVGTAVAGAGDVDGDGFDDVIVGADFDGGAGSARLYSGADGSELWRLLGSEPDARFGLDVAGAGDVDGDGLADLIVGVPYHDGGGHDAGRAEVHAGRAALGASYCGPAVSNSTGLAAEIAAFGSQLASQNQLLLVANALPPNQPGYFLASTSAGFVAAPGGSQGNLCLGGTIARFASQVASSGSDGRLELAVDLTAAPFDPPVAAGETWRFQAWFRDANPGPTSNFTNGVAVGFR